MAEQDNTAAAKQNYQDFMTGNIDGLLDSFAEDIEWELPETENVPFARTYKGRAGAADFFKQLGEHQDPVSFNPREFIAQGDKVVVLGDYAWKVKKNGREFKGDFAHVFTYKDGKAIAFKEYLDTAAISAAYK